jgi:hypothetical protein
VLADTAARDGLGRVVNALIRAKESRRAETRSPWSSTVLARSGWVLLSEDEHRYHRLFEDVRDRNHGRLRVPRAGVRGYGEVEAAGGSSCSTTSRHPSLRSFVADGYHVLTF